VDLQSDFVFCQITLVLVAVFRIESVDSSLDQAGVGKELDTLSTDTVTALTSSLQLTQCELTACRDCCNEALNQLAKLTNVTTQQSVHKSRM